MITKTVTFAQDENTGVAIYLGKLVKFNGDEFNSIDADGALEIYVEKGMKVPPEFPTIRDALQKKMTALGALL